MDNKKNQIQIERYKNAGDLSFMTSLLMNQTRHKTQKGSKGDGSWLEEGLAKRPLSRVYPAFHEASSFQNASFGAEY